MFGMSLLSDRDLPRSLKSRCNFPFCPRQGGSAGAAMKGFCPKDRSFQFANGVDQMSKLPLLWRSAPSFERLKPGAVDTKG